MRVCYFKAGFSETGEAFFQPHFSTLALHIESSLRVVKTYNEPLRLGGIKLMAFEQVR